MTTRVPIVDDDPKITTALRRGPRYQGYDVATAATGDQALSVARPHHPHLILPDTGSPDPDGIEACRRLSVEDKPPIITRTARDDATDKVATPTWAPPSRCPSRLRLTSCSPGCGPCCGAGTADPSRRCTPNFPSTR
jgi:CheY-like chemotaxis protein